MSRYEIKAVMIPGDVNDFIVADDGLHNAWAIFESGDIKYAFEFEDNAEEVDQRRNAERMLEWCQKREARYGQAGA
jgi:hypothetical protein